MSSDDSVKDIESYLSRGDAYCEKGEFDNAIAEYWLSKCDSH